MSSTRSRRLRRIPLLAAVAASGALVMPTPAQAVAGTPTTGSAYAFTAKIAVGDAQACTGALVDAQWVLTAASCFGQQPVPAGAPKVKTTATIGRADLATTTGHVVDIAELVPRADRDLVMARLATPVLDVAPVVVSTTAPVAGETLRGLGYGRTKDTWVPNRVHTGSFTVNSVTATSVGITPAAGSAICKGDAGGPALRETDGKTELVAVHSASWQGGCLGSDETRTGAVETRLDDIAPWIQQVRALPQESQIVSGDFNKDGKSDVAAFYDNGTSVDGKNMASLHAFYSDGTGFAAPRKVWSTPGGFTWAASKVTSGDYTGDGRDDIAVLYNGGKAADGRNISSLYIFASTGSGFSAPRKSWTTSSTGSFNWNASKVTSGDYNGDAKDDVAVLYDRGTSPEGRRLSALFTFASDGTDFTAPKETWAGTGAFNWDASQVVSGDYDGDGKSDVGVFYNGGKAADGDWVSSLFTFTSTGTAFNAPRNQWTSTGSFSWNASKAVSGDYNGDGKSDVGVLYNGGKAADGDWVSSLFTFTSTGTAFNAPRNLWTSTGSFSWAASTVTSGDYTGDRKHDVGVYYDNGKSADGRQANSLWSFVSTGTDIQAPVRRWNGSVV
ncbi:trypsin-like serine protease [Streptomyces sp. NPDC020965]|uniref:trypsin-like serine protease n=1 Tax=Streptomyces sp. NPDC020965 TaxID=3365105 RepID=UPI0037BC4BC4